MRNARSVSVLFLFMVTGAILGGILGEIINHVDAMAGIAPYLTQIFPVFHLPPFTINLYVLQIVLGLTFSPNLVSILGVILAVWLFRRF